MEQFQFKIEVQWPYGGKSGFTLKIKYDPVKTGDGDALKKFENTWQWAMISSLTRIGERGQNLTFEVLTTPPEGERFEHLSYGGESFNIEIDNNNAVLPYIEERLRIAYARMVFDQQFKNLAATFSALTNGYKIVGFENETLYYKGHEDPE